MEQITKTTKTTSCLFVFLISFYLFMSLDMTSTYSSGYYASILSFLAAFVVLFLIVLVIRTTTVAWITVLVLLAFAGKRRRILIKEGRKITSDVAMYLVQDVIKERRLVAFVCATFVSIIGMAWVRIGDHGSM